MNRFCVVWYVNGLFKGVVSGMGRHRGTCDSAADSRRTAQRWAKQLRAMYPNDVFVIDHAV